MSVITAVATITTALNVILTVFSGAVIFLIGGVVLWIFADACLEVARGKQ